MKRNGSLLLTPKKKTRIETQSEEEDHLSNSESDGAGQEHEVQNDDLAEQSEDEQDSDEEDDGEQDSNEEEDVEDSEDATQAAEDGDSDEAEECSEQDDDGNEDHNTQKLTTARKTTPRNKVQRVTPLVKKKQRKAGVIYISSIPKHMNVTILRSLLEPFGDIGRIYLQPAQTGGQVRTKTASGKRAMMQYTEGWVEFLDKRVAKAIVPMLNMQPITNKKKSVFRDILWSMKYLSGFKWIHLNERLSYERAVAKDKMREQIEQIRKEVSYHETKVHHKERALKNAAREKKEKSKKQ
uniref:Activator of basal transcription 1 n=1 Tax=Anopheles christyi TaxID=43041 RepID=A0A182K5U2_9DIPT